MINSVYLHKEDIQTLLDFMEAFPTSSNIVEVTSDSSSGIGAVVTARLHGVDMNGHLVTISKTLVDESSW